MDILNIFDITKSFGTNKVIDHLSFSIPEHSVFGFIGQNGAGKTTTMKMILGLLKADSGEILVNGEKVTFGQNRTNQYIGYLPDVPEFYGFMTSAEYLTMCGRVTGMDKEKIRKKSSELLELVGLENVNKRIHSFSRGMKQRLGIAQALINSPKLLICDEPTSALDPIGRKEILDILSSVRQETTVLFSTHILSDVERICDRIALLNDGKIALEGTIEEIKDIRKGSQLEIEFYQHEDAALVARQYTSSCSTYGARLLFAQKTKEDMHEIMAYLVEKNISIRRMEMLEPTLENLFMEVIGR